MGSQTIGGQCTSLEVVLEVGLHDLGRKYDFPDKNYDFKRAPGFFGDYISI